MIDLEPSLPDGFNLAIGVFAGGAITLIVAWLFFRWTSKQTEGHFQKASTENTNMLRTLAHFLEQLGADFGLEIAFKRDDSGRIDLTRPGVVRRVTVPKEGVVLGDRADVEVRRSEDRPGGTS
ncbi:MAG: hypothetical protein ACREK5_10570 [Gemmatimonadota bacterium]